MAKLLLALLGTAAASNYTSSDGCTTLENSADAGSAITKVSLKCAMRGAIAHCGIEFETAHGKYALAYNSKTVPGPVSTPGCVWCQSGGMPMKDSKANGDCGGCGGWKTAGGKDSVTGKFKTLKDFMKDVKKWGDDRPDYNIAACDDHSSNQANCQLSASELYKKLVGKRSSKCTACEGSCF